MLIDNNEVGALIFVDVRQSDGITDGQVASDFLNFPSNGEFLRASRFGEESDAQG
jgi:hypothetical protein